MKNTFKKSQEPQRGHTKILFRIFLYIAIAALMFWGISFWNTSTFPSEPPMQEKTSAYRQVLNFAPSWPFYYKYYLYIPENYDAKKQYPLVLLLHGQNRHMRGGTAYLKSGISYTNPAFIVVPIAPPEMIWGSPQKSESEALPLAMDALRDTQKSYSIDSNRIYVSGYSMGGAGTFAMLERYPDIFAAAIALCGSWDTSRASLFPNSTPILAAHGSLDGPESSRNMVNALKAAGKKAYYSEYPNVGHNVWDYVYTDARIWSWLFAQKKELRAAF